MAERRKIKTEKGLALVPGANKLLNGCNFALEVPEGSSASLVLYKKRARKPFVEIPFTEEDRTGNMYAFSIPDFKSEDYEYNFIVDGRIYTDPWEENVLVRQQTMILTK